MTLPELKARITAASAALVVKILDYVDPECDVIELAKLGHYTVKDLTPEDFENLEAWIASDYAGDIPPTFKAYLRTLETAGLLRDSQA